MSSGSGYEALRRGRSSEPESRYFLTLTTEGRKAGLTSAALAKAIKREIDALESDHAWHVHAAVIMPDHLHLLITLGGRLTLGQAIGRLKSKTRARLAEINLLWQGNYFDRHLRPDDLIEDVLRYVFLNPYRAKLLALNEHYEWTWLGTEEAVWFTSLTDDARPFPEWLR